MSGRADDEINDSNVDNTDNATSRKRGLSTNAMEETERRKRSKAASGKAPGNPNESDDMDVDVTTKKTQSGVAFLPTASRSWQGSLRTGPNPNWQDKNIVMV